MKACSRLPAERCMGGERFGIAKIGPQGEGLRFPDQPTCCPPPLLTVNLGQTLRDGQPVIFTARTYKSGRPGAGKCWQRGGRGQTCVLEFPSWCCDRIESATTCAAANSFHTFTHVCWRREGWRWQTFLSRFFSVSQTVWTGPCWGLVATGSYLSDSACNSLQSCGSLWAIIIIGMTGASTLSLVLSVHDRGWTLICSAQPAS